MGWGFLEKVFNKVHDFTGKYDPLGHALVDMAHQSSTDIVNETMRLGERAFGDTWLGKVSTHWKDMSQKDKDDFGRWASNTAMTAAAVYGGMAGAESAGAGGAGAGAGEAGAAGAVGAGGAEAGGALGYGLGGTAGYAVPTTSGAVGAGGTAAAAGGGMAAAGGGGGWAPAATQAVNALYGAYQSKKAADALTASGDAANATQRYMFDTLNALQAPYRGTAYNALDNINALQRDPSSVVNDPGYEFGRSQGMRGIDNSASARGGIGGAALKAGSRFNTDYATTKLNDVYNRNFTAAGLGQTSNAQTGQFGMNYANNVADTQMIMGKAQAANSLNQGNIYGNALNALAAYYGGR